MTARRRSEPRTTSHAHSKPIARGGIAPPPLPGALRLVATLVAFACIAAVVSFPVGDPDLWQHLATGRAMWEQHRLEPSNVWTWPSFGQPYVIVSWLFRALLWPFWSAGGVLGLFFWRWLTTLACFWLLWRTARASKDAGATGLAALFVLVWCAVHYRFRSQLRPETLVAVLLALQIATLEWRRARVAGGAAVASSSRLDPAWFVPLIAMVWINVHLSYVVGLLVTGAYLLDELWRARRRDSGATPMRLGLVLLASMAASFLNPYGFGLVRQPFDFALVERKQLIMRIITELGPIPLGAYLPTGLPLLVALPVLLALWRWRRRGPDVAQLAIYGYFIPQGLMSQRFIGYTAIAVAPFFARDASEFCATRRWPAWLVAPATRAGLAAALLAALMYATFDQRSLWPRVAFRESMIPIGACDAIASKEIRGKSFNQFSYGGYLLWRFWPEKDRLPFTDVHVTGSPVLRDAYVQALVDPAGWASLDLQYRFDWVLLGRTGQGRAPLLDVLDADTTRWSLVFADDVAALYARRGGASAAAAERHRYHWLPGGPRRLQEVANLMGADTLIRAAMVTELERCTRESKWTAAAHLMLGNLAVVETRWPEALTHYDAARAVAPDLQGAHLRRGTALLGVGRAAEALEELKIARRRESPPASAEFMMGRAFRALGRPNDARRAWQRALALDPGLHEASDSIAVLDRGTR